jgi:hypothetical protein
MAIISNTPTFLTTKHLPHNLLPPRLSSHCMPTIPQRRRSRSRPRSIWPRCSGTISFDRSRQGRGIQLPICILSAGGDRRSGAWATARRSIILVHVVLRRGNSRQCSVADRCSLLMIDVFSRGNTASAACGRFGLSIHVLSRGDNTCTA